MRRKKVGNDGGAVREERSSANSLNHPQADNFERPGNAGAPGQRQQHRGQGKDREPDRIDPYPPKHIGYATDCNERRGYDRIAQ